MLQLGDGDERVDGDGSTTVRSGGAGGGQIAARSGVRFDGGGHERAGNGAGRTPARDADGDLTGEVSGHGGAGEEQLRPTRGRGATADVERQQTTPSRPIVVREKVKSLKMKKFKSLDNIMPITMWLKTVRAKVRRQAATMGVEWRDDQLYHEMTSYLEEEAQRWFATVMESVAPEAENIETLATMLPEKYMTQRSGPEVVDLPNASWQMRGERLAAYARSLREIAERAVDKAVSHVGEYGEGYGVGLEAALVAWSERETSAARSPVATAAGEQELSAIAGNFGSVVSGYGPMWGMTPEAPRCDTERRLLSAKETGMVEWWKAISPGYQLVPVAAVTSGGSKNRTSSGHEQYGRAKRQGDDQYAKRPAKTFKIEGSHGGAGVYGTPRSELVTREQRLVNQKRYEAQNGGQAPFVPRPGTTCFYHGEEGHFARYWRLKEEDLAKRTKGQDSQEKNTCSGNGQRA
ncbi:Hypothetical protein PHPALM_17835 [Phytophthora palmivora]|uniref:Retrotransposon gag domain-containing protein n=1 Tax=Phytophthora palmivora TaxID=4796 RepID=A0A2P4XL80_9STRA|nr:Hypothetical protein PHPALM_17835 [Phytophthora palmivora]